jgi:hypothetical protein
LRAAANLVVKILSVHTSRAAPDAALRVRSSGAGRAAAQAR